jgi:hypothetical protein
LNIFSTGLEKLNATANCTNPNMKSSSVVIKFLNFWKGEWYYVIDIKLLNPFDKTKDNSKCLYSG